MQLIEKIDALLHCVSRRDLDAMAPARRRRFAEALRRIADLADPPALPAPPRSGVLYDLRFGRPE